MSKRLKTGKSRASSAVKAVVKGSHSAAASALSTVGHQKTKAAVGSWSYRGVKSVSVERVHSAPTVAAQMAQRADPSLLDPYDWGPEGVPKGKPLRYVPGQGFVVED